MNLFSEIDPGIWTVVGLLLVAILQGITIRVQQWVKKSTEAANAKLLDDQTKVLKESNKNAVLDAAVTGGIVAARANAQTNEKLDILHSYMNGGQGAILEALAIALERIAKNSGDQADIIAADIARKTCDQHKSQAQNLK